MKETWTRRGVETVRDSLSACRMSPTNTGNPNAARMIASPMAPRPAEREAEQDPRRVHEGV